ncbi:histidine-containing phosphotransfer protein 2-like [Populus alba x Populus x berolinensis]|nr:histidine-containing phosphotransfer protein 2-like [Populus alba x Populus x berolinensis]
MAGLAALEALTEKLYDFIQSMEDDGIVDHHFKDCYNLKDANGPFLFIELLTTYISDSETTLEEITIELHNYLAYAFSGAGLGACRVATSCGEFRQAAIARNKDDCLLRLEVIKGDFSILHNKLEAFLELERRIVTNDYQGC